MLNCLQICLCTSLRVARSQVQAALFSLDILAVNTVLGVIYGLSGGLGLRTRCSSCVSANVIRKQWLLSIRFYCDASMTNSLAFGTGFISYFSERFIAKDWIQLLLFIFAYKWRLPPEGWKEEGTPGLHLLVRCHMMGHVVKIYWWQTGTYRSNFTHNHSSGLHTLWWKRMQDYLFVCLLCFIISF